MRWASVASLWLLLPLSASATTIHYTATDISDTVAGDDLWQYSYTVTDFSFPAGFGFSIFFDYALFTQIQDPAPPVNIDWDVLTLQPDLFLPDDGIYDALALVDSAPPLDLFTVEFVWLGSGAPGAQPFSVYDESFADVETGTTIPEPNTLTLIGTGLLAIALARKLPVDKRLSGVCQC